MSKLSREEFEKLMKEGRLDEVLEAVQVPLKSEPWKAKEMQLQEEMEGLVKLAKQEIADEAVRDEAKAFSAFAPLGADIFCPAGTELSEADRAYIEEFRAQAKAQLERIRGPGKLVPVTRSRSFSEGFDAGKRAAFDEVLEVMSRYSNADDAVSFIEVLVTPEEETELGGEG